MTELTQNVSYGFLLLRRNPGFTAAAVLSLALGIGADTTIFSMLDSGAVALLRDSGILPADEHFHEPAGPPARPLILPKLRGRA